MNITSINTDTNVFTVEMYKPEGMFQVTQVEWDLLSTMIKNHPGLVQAWIEEQSPLKSHQMNQIMSALSNHYNYAPLVRLRSEFPETIEYPMAIYNLCSRLSKEANPITGIKFLREMYNLGLKDAKDLYDAIKNHASQEPKSLGELLKSKFQTEEARIIREVRNLIDNHNHIAAIKAIKSQWGLSLKEAKDIVDAMRDGNTYLPCTSSEQQVVIFNKLKA